MRGYDWSWKLELPSGVVDISEVDSQESKKKMSNTSRIEIKKFNGQNFELWKLKMEDLLVDREQWVAVEPRSKPKSISDEYWMKLNRKGRSTIRLCLADLVLLNVSEEDTVKKLWDKLGNLYQSNSMVNKLFVLKKLYLLRMNDDDSVTKQLNAFNIVISQLLSMDVKIIEEKKCISLLCSWPDTWNNFVVSIGRNNTTLKINDVVVALLSEEMRQNIMEGLTLETLSVRGQSISRNKGKPFSGRSKLRGKSRSRSKSPGQLTRRCWTCGKPRHYKKYYKLKGVGTSKDSEVT